MKKWLKVTLLIVVIIIVAMIIVFNLAASGLVKTLEANPVKAVDFSQVKDGKYTGIFDAQIVSAKVEVTMLDGRLTDVKLMKHNHGKDYGADDILQRVLDQQSIEVDIITGATSSSQVVLKAIENALRKGILDIEKTKNK